MNFDDLERRVTELENKTWLWDIAGFMAGILVLLGVIDFIKWIWHLIFG
jgi:hypothetical protein